MPTPNVWIERRANIPLALLRAHSRRESVSFSKYNENGMGEEKHKEGVIQGGIS